jgi:hypothetical protein
LEHRSRSGDDDVQLILQLSVAKGPLHEEHIVFVALTGRKHFADSFAWALEKDSADSRRPLRH